MTMNTKQTIRTILRSDELSCPSCVAKIEKSLHSLDGVTNAKVHFSAGRIEVDHDPKRSATGELVEAVRKAGYAARPSAF